MAHGSAGQACFRQFRPFKPKTETYAIDSDPGPRSHWHWPTAQLAKRSPMSIMVETCVPEHRRRKAARQNGAERQPKKLQPHIEGIIINHECHEHTESNKLMPGQCCNLDNRLQSLNPNIVPPFLSLLSEAHYFIWPSAQTARHSCVVSNVRFILSPKPLSSRRRPEMFFGWQLTWPILQTWDMSETDFRAREAPSMHARTSNIGAARLLRRRAPAGSPSKN